MKHKFTKPPKWIPYIEDGEPVVRFEDMPGHPAYLLKDPFVRARIIEHLNGKNTYSKDLVEVGLSVLLTDAHREGEKSVSIPDPYEEDSLTVALYVFAQKNCKDRQFEGNTQELLKKLVLVAEDEKLDYSRWPRHHLGAFSRQIKRRVERLKKHGVILEKSEREAKRRSWVIGLQTAEGGTAKK